MFSGVRVFIFNLEMLDMGSCFFRVLGASGVSGVEGVYR